MVFCAAGAPAADYYWAFFELGWVNYYELQLWDLEEEIELVGWALGVYNAAGLAAVSCLLSVACLCAVNLTLLARRLRFSAREGAAASRRAGARICLRVQAARTQEWGGLGRPRQALHLFHRRRT